MKKIFYVLLALLVSMELVFGVSCDNSNKAPGGAKDLGTDKVRVPSWADGEYSAMDGFIGLSVTDGNFKVSMMQSSIPIVDSLNINDIESQTTDDEKKIYTLNAVVSVDLSPSEAETAPTDEKIYSSFVMQLTDSGIDVTITSEDPVLSTVEKMSPISFTRDTGSTE